MSAGKHTPDIDEARLVANGYRRRIGCAALAIGRCPHCDRRHTETTHTAFVRRIVQCVNAHDELVTAARRASTLIRADGMHGCADELDAAIAKATGSTSEPDPITSYYADKAQRGQPPGNPR